jgi:RsiW-degrading membrane proteinase PrsW (M82 family)
MPPQQPAPYPQQGAPQFPGRPAPQQPPQPPPHQFYPPQPPFPPQPQPQPQPGVPPYGATPFPSGWPQLPPTPVSHFNPAMLLPIQHWLRDRSLRNWITILFVALVVVPSIALVYVGDDTSKISKSTWAFAIYFACAWLLVLWISIRPPMVRPLMLLEVGAIGLVFEAPLAIWLEKKLETPHQNLFSYIFTVGLPEEFVKILPVVVLGVVLKRVWGPLTPKDYLFLGAVSGLAFGAAEAVQYINVYIPEQSALVAQQAAQNNADPASLGQFIAMTSIQSGSWRFVTDPMSHAVWAGISGYFVGLAFQHRRYLWLALVGLGLTSLLHGINDDVAGHWFWIVEIIVSVLLFMAYVQAGGVIEQQLTEADEAHARAHPQPAFPMPVPGGMPAPGWGAPVAAQPAPGWAPTGYGTGSMPVAPSWNPAAGWGQSGFTPIRGYRAPGAPSQPGPPPPPPQR